MAISFINGNTATATNGGDPSVNMSSWSLQQNDLVVAALTIGDSVDYTMAMVSAGYTLVPGSDLFANDGSASNLAVFYKFMGSSPDTTCVGEGGGSAVASVAIAVMAFRGVNTTTPLDVSATTDTNINGWTATPASISIVTTGAFVLVAASAGHGRGSTATYGSPPTGYTTNFKTAAADDGTDCTIGLGYNSSPSIPETPGNLVPTGTDSTGYSACAVTLALRPQTSSTAKFFPFLDRR